MDLIRWMQDNPFWGLYICGGVIMTALRLYSYWWEWSAIVDEWHSRGPLGKAWGMIVMVILNPALSGPLWPMAAGFSLYTYIQGVRADIREEREKAQKASDVT